MERDSLDVVAAERYSALDPMPPEPEPDPADYCPHQEQWMSNDGPCCLQCGALLT